MGYERAGVVLAAVGLLAGRPAAGQERHEPTRVLVVYYSETGNTEAMARAVRDGARRVADVTVVLRAVAEAREEEILAADGIVVGTPVYWASLASPVKAFLERLGNALVAAGRLDQEGRTAGAFCTGGAVAAGKELARLAILSAFLNMRFVVLGGVAADGFGTLGPEATTGPADPGVSEAELDEARRFGERFARWTKRIRTES